jgi:hypothetical protein
VEGSQINSRTAAAAAAATTTTEMFAHVLKYVENQTW